MELFSLIYSFFLYLKSVFLSDSIKNKVVPSEKQLTKKVVDCSLHYQNLVLTNTLFNNFPFEICEDQAFINEKFLCILKCLLRTSSWVF